MSTYKPLIVIAGHVYQLDDPDGLQVAHLTSTDYVQFDTTYTDGFVEGRLQWNSADGTLEVGMPGGNVNLQIGQETLVRVRNATGNTVNNGTLVTINGSQANRPKIEVFDDSIHDVVCGYTTETINNNSYGYVTLRGVVRDIDTSTFNEGDHLWADVNNPGQVTNVMPVPPQHRRCVGVVLVADANNGMVYADFETWHHLEELSDVNIASANLVGGEAIIWDVDNQYWKATGSPDAFPQYSHLKTGWNPDAFVNDVDITVNSGNRTITVSPQGDEAEFWTGGIKHTINGPVSTTWNDTEGVWFFTIDGDGINASQTGYDISDESNALLSVLYWDADNNDVVTWSPETHAWEIPRKLHEYLHDTFGTRWAEGLGVTLNTSNTTVDVGNGTIYDEDQQCTIQNTGGTTKWVQQLKPLMSYKEYRTGASGYWRRVGPSTSLVTLNGTIPQINTWNGSSYVLSNVGVAKYFAMWVVASTSGDGYPVYLLVGQAEGGTITEAQETNTLVNLDVNSIASREHKILARLILQRTASSPYYSVASIDDYRDVADESITGGATPATGDHGSLTGLGDDDHTQYVLADGSRDITGNITVNGTVTANGLTSTGNLSIGSGNTVIVTTNLDVNGFLDVSTINSSSPVFTINAGGTIALEDNVIVSGNITGGSLNLSSYLINYAGSPSNNDVLTWVTANSRAEFKAPTGGSGSGPTITSNTTYYLDPTGNDTTGDGSANSPWFTINKAYEALANEVIAGGVQVTIQLNDGTYNYTSTVSPYHPQASQIFVTGETTHEITTSNLVSISGTQPNRQMVLTVNDTANCSVGDIIEIRNATSGYFPLLNGATQITSVNTSNSTITCNWFQISTTYAPSPGAVTANITVHKTNVTFNGCDGFLAQNNGQLNIGKIGFDGVDLNNTLFYAYGTGRILTTSNGLSVIRFLNGVQASYGGYVRCERASFGRCYRGIYVNVGGEVFANYAIVNGATNTGVNLDQGGWADCSYLYVFGGAANGMVVSNSRIFGDNCRSQGNAGTGMVVHQGSSAFINYVTIAWNNGRGILTQFGSFSEMSNCNVASNSDTGVYFFGQSGGRVALGSITNNSNGGLYCANNSSCQITGATIASNGSFQYSPTPINVVGNNESFVH